MNFTYTGNYESKDVLFDLNMQLAPGSRCLLIGANGAGKSTLLRILGGKHLTKPDGAVRVLGMDAFRDMRLNMQRAYLDTNWGLRTVAFAGYGCPLTADIEVRWYCELAEGNSFFMIQTTSPAFYLKVGSMMEKLQAEWPERRDELIELLGIDPKWRMHQVISPATSHVWPERWCRFPSALAPMHYFFPAAVLSGLGWAAAARPALPRTHAPL